MISLLALSILPLLQDPGDKPERLKPLVPAPENFQPKKPGRGPSTPVPPSRNGLSVDPGLSGNQASNRTLDDTLPRSQVDGRPLPFSVDRPLLRIDGVTIRADELNQLVAYYRSYRSGSDDLMLQDAVKALLPVKVMEARFQAQLPAMQRRIRQAHEAVQQGTDFAAVVAEYSQDTEAPTADGRYTFGRERAVQPFDRISHTSAVDALSDPFLTVYGYHFLQVVAYQRGAQPQDDQTTVRHILVMFPEMVTLEQQGQDVRAWYKEQVRKAKIEVLEDGMRNLVPPQNRSQIVGG